MVQLQLVLNKCTYAFYLIVQFNGYTTLMNNTMSVKDQFQFSALLKIYKNKVLDIEALETESVIADRKKNYKYSRVHNFRTFWQYV